MKWAEKVRLLMGFDISAKQIYNMRLNIERTLREENHKKGFDFEFKIKDLYRKLLESFYLSNLTENLNYDLADKMHEIELKIEKEYQFVSQKSLKMLQKLKQQNKKLFIVSDFYMGADDIGLFLKNLNLDTYFEKIFVSSDYLKIKSTGKLYKFALNELNANANDCLMIGDNGCSDVKVPKKLGISVKHFNAKSNYKRYENQKKCLKAKKYSSFSAKFFAKTRNIILKTMLFNCIFSLGLWRRSVKKNKSNNFSFWQEKVKF